MEIESAQKKVRAKVLDRRCKNMIQLIAKDGVLYIRVGLQRVYFFITLKEMMNIMEDFTNISKYAPGYEKRK